jgi:hypothetical protein
MSVKCKICGIEKQYSIVEHLKFEHKLTSKEYKELYPGNLVKSKEYATIFSEKQKTKWSDTEYKQKMTKSRQVSHNKSEFKNKMSNIIKKRHKETPEIYSGFTNWHKSEKFKEWVKSEDRIKKISKTSKERWENEEYRQKTIKSIVKVLGDGRCEKGKEFRENMSKIISELYSTGKLSNTSNKYKTGKYESKENETFLYSSSYELETMIFFDSVNFIKRWTNKHGIRIRYFYNGLHRNYVPDFYIELANGKIFLIELKGWETEEVLVKQQFALKEYPNYKLFYSVEELKNFIYENNED